MLIGILSDIHSNSEALRRVLHEARNLNVTHLLVLGDLIGYYYDANGVFDLLQNWERNVIRGNHEDMLLGIVDKNADIEEIKKKYGSGLFIASNSLSKKRIEEIRNFESTSQVNFNGINILLAHGAPWNTSQYIYPNADLNLLNRCNMPGVDYVFIGHTHYPMSFKGSNTRVVNPGSVGQSRAKGGIADWGVLNTQDGNYEAMQTSYDTSKLKIQARQIDPDVPYLVEVLERNVK